MKYTKLATTHRPTLSRATARPTRATVRPDRLVFPIYRKYLIPNKPSQTKPKTNRASKRQPSHAKPSTKACGRDRGYEAGGGKVCGMRQGRAEYLLTLAALSTSTSDVQSKYSVWQRLRQRGSEAARRRHHEPDCQSVGQFVRSFSSSVVNGKPEVHPMFGVLLATATAPHPRRPHKALWACFSLECCEGEGG